MKEDSPFTPGYPVSPELFVGREKQLKEIQRYIKLVASGKMENVFLSGERGIGKTSLANYLRELALKENFITIHVFLGGVCELEELVRIVFEEIYKDYNTQNWFKKVSDFFGKYIREVDLFGVSVSFSPPNKDLKELVRKFPEAIYNIIDKLKDDKKGIFIVLDDINGIVSNDDFAHWYKSFVDKIATSKKVFPILLMPVGLPEIRDTLSKQQPSLMRIFRVVEFTKLSDEEVKNFFIKAFKKVNKEVNSKELDLMVMFSSGLPVFMQEIGDAVFLNSQDKVITFDDVRYGIVDAADRIGKKYLDPQVYRTLRSDKYRTILRKMGNKLIFKFKKTEMKKLLNEKEIKVFDNFLRRMRELGIIIEDIEEGPGAYRFVNDLYPVYIMIENIRYKSSKKNKNYF